MQGETDIKQPLFCIMPTRQTIPFVFDSPHSGTVYPEDFDHCCDRYLLQQTADSYVDELFSGAPAAGAPLLAAHFPRCYVDVNRAETDIDLELLPEHAISAKPEVDLLELDDLLAIRLPLSVSNCISLVYVSSTSSCVRATFNSNSASVTASAFPCTSRSVTKPCLNSPSD